MQRTFLQFSTPPILSSVESELTDSRPVKTIKMGKCRFHCFIMRSVEVTCIATFIILENMFGNIKPDVFYLRGKRGERIVLLSLDVCRWSISVSVRYLSIYLFTLFKVGKILTNKNYLIKTNRQIKNIYIHTLNKIKHKC